MTIMTNIAMNTPLRAAAGAVHGALAGAVTLGLLAPLKAQVKIGEELGRAFGRVVAFPVGVVCKGVNGLANKLRSSAKPSKSMDQYSIEIARTGSQFGKMVALGATIVTWPLLLKIAPYTAAAGAVLGGIFGAEDGIKYAKNARCAYYESQYNPGLIEVNSQRLPLDIASSVDYIDSEPEFTNEESGYGSGSASDKNSDSVFWD